MKILAYCPSSSWKIDGEKNGNGDRLYFLRLQNSDCSHEIKRCLLLERKSYDQPRQYIKKQRHYFANKGPSVKAMVFPVVMCGYESWTIKKAEG